MAETQYLSEEEMEQLNFTYLGGGMSVNPEHPMFLVFQRLVKQGLLVMKPPTPDVPHWPFFEVTDAGRDIANGVN